MLPLDPAFPEWGDSRYVDLTLDGELRLADALNHLYVLLPVLDDNKHYWVAPDEIEKLLRAGEGWLAGHPERALIIRRYLAHSRALAAKADAALAPLEETPADDSVAEGPVVEKTKPLNVRRRAAVMAALAETGATRVLDLGCGGGALLGDLIREKRYTEIVGADVSPKVLEIAERRLRLKRLPDRQRARIKLVQSALTYVDERLRGYDAAVLMEVIEHLDLPRLPALCAAVFGDAKPGAVVVTTPNVEYNVRYETLPEGGHRHDDHRFEWTRAEFAAWCDQVAADYGYTYTLRDVGDTDPEVGPPTQLALFVKTEPHPAGITETIATEEVPA